MKYETGTVTVADGSNQIVGVGTSWLTAQPWLIDASVPRFLSIPYFGVVLPVIRIVDNTHLLVSRPFRTIPGGHASMSGLDYAIAADFSPFRGMPLPRDHDVNKAQLMNRGIKLIDEGFEDLS